MVAGKYVIGSPNPPSWFSESTKSGRIKMEYEDGEFIRAKVNGVTKVFIALPGDVIIHTKNGLSVVKSDDAKKYKIE